MTGKDIHARGRAITRLRRTASATPDNTPEERTAAAKTVASNSADATDCAELLDMLGLTPGEGRADRQGSAVPSLGVRGRATRRR